jgi:Zn/Cd-binding protein ZinT
MNRKRTLLVSLVLALVAAVFAVPGIQLAGGTTERLANGNFESGFSATPVGFVGKHWNWFHNGGEATYGFYDDTWAPVVYDGKHSQLLEINTYCRAGSDPDRYSGIYQTVAVVPGENYDLTIRGMLRALEDDPDRANYSYRVQYGIDYNGGNDWKAVADWHELPWDTVYPRLSPGSMASFSTTVKATSDRLTLFIRVWKKWGTAQRELDVNLDGISLRGAMPEDVDAGAPKPATDESTTMADYEMAEGVSVYFEAPDYPTSGWEYTITAKAKNDVGITKLEFYDDGSLVGSTTYDVGPLSVSEDYVWKPATTGDHTLKAVAHDASGATATHNVTVNVGSNGSFLTNGDFESGFWFGPAGEVGNDWAWFHNGGEASYGFYDDTWPPVLVGKHSQLIEINTFCRAGSDPDRYAGIFQTAEGLTVGATYKFSLKGMLRALADDEDRDNYSYRVEWGYTTDGSTDWRDVDNWVEIPWDKVYPRLEPGSMKSYSAEFEATSTQITLFVRAWKKWGTARRELDVNLDNIQLRGYK